MPNAKKHKLNETVTSNCCGGACSCENCSCSCQCQCDCGKPEKRQ